MVSLEYMNRSSKRGIFLSSVLLFSLIIILNPTNVFADEITIKNMSFEETTILELTNEAQRRKLVLLEFG